MKKDNTVGPVEIALESPMEKAARQSARRAQRLKEIRRAVKTLRNVSARDLRTAMGEGKA